MSGSSDNPHPHAVETASIWPLAAFGTQNCRDLMRPMRGERTQVCDAPRRGYFAERRRVADKP